MTAHAPEMALIGWAVWFALGCFGTALLLCLYRVVFSPALTDRILALDTMTINVIAALVIVLAIRPQGLFRRGT